MDVSPCFPLHRIYTTVTNLCPQRIVSVVYFFLMNILPCFPLHRIYTTVTNLCPQSCRDVAHTTFVCLIQLLRSRRERDGLSKFPLPYLLHAGLPCPPPPPDMQGSTYKGAGIRLEKRFLVDCSSPFVRLAEHLTALRAWCTRCLPGLGENPTCSVPVL